MIQSPGQGALAVPIPQVTTDQSMGSSHVSLADFMDSGMLEGSKPDRIMQVDGIDSCSDSYTEAEDIFIYLREQCTIRRSN